MALAPARQAGGRAARIADFWRISAVFDPIAGGPGAISPADETRADFPGAGIPGSGARFSDLGQRCPGRYVWGGQHGARCGLFHWFNRP